MQRINYKEVITLENKINELLLINIDEKLIHTKQSDTIKVGGQININGEVSTDKGKECFLHNIDVDILLSKDQLINEEVNITVDDFEYILKNNTIHIDLIIKIDGLKEIEPYFPSQEDQEDIQVEEVFVFDEDRNESIREELIDTPNEINSSIIEDSPIYEQKAPYSLLKQIFKHKVHKSDSSYLFHVVKNEKSYKEIADAYALDEEFLKHTNNDEDLLPGKLIFIPK